MPTVARAVTFDLWHTLLYLDPEAEDSYSRQQSELGGELLRDSPVQGEGTLTPIDAVRSVSLEAIRLSEQGESLSLGDQIARAAALSGRTVDPVRYVSRLEQLVASSPFRVAPGARETLAEIADLGVRIGVVANTVGEPGRALRRICDREGLGTHLAGWSWSDELPWTKPSPRIFLHCLEQLGGVPSQAVHVGDGASDIEGARNANFRASVLYTGLAEYGTFYRTFVVRKDPTVLRPDYTVTRLDELPALIGEIFGSPRQ